MKSIDNIEKSLDERFDEKLFTIRESHIKEFDLQKKPKKTSSFFHIEFSESIPENTKEFLKEKIPNILDFPSKFGLNPVFASNSLYFIDKDTYEKEMGQLLPENIRLPASSLKTNSTQKKFKIIIILPNFIDKADVLVNITRNIFSKLCGKIYFEEQIMPLEFYNQHSKEQKRIFVGIPEILNLINEFNFPSKILSSNEEPCLNSSKTFLKRQFNDFQKKMLIEWGEKWKDKKLSLDEKHIIESIFSEFIDEFNKNPEKFFKSISKQIKILNSEINFILPHEISTYVNFESNRFIHFIRVVKLKLEEINSLTEFIEEIDSLLKNKPDLDDLNTLNKLIHSRMKKMVKEKKVIKFFIPELLNNSDFKKLKKKLPLFLIKFLPKGTPISNWSKEIKKLETNYSSSIYSKIYSSLHSLSLWIVELQKSNNRNFLESVDGKNLKKLIYILKYRTNSLRMLENNLGIFLEAGENLSSKITNEKLRHYIPLGDLCNAWSYFISYILTLHYYREFAHFKPLAKGFNSDNFLKSILNFVEKKCYEGINHFHIAKLLWLLYENEKTYSLEFVIFCIKKPENILRYILHQVILPENEKKNIEIRLRKLNNYRDALNSVYQKRFYQQLIRKKQN